jgi:flavodoxin
MDISKKSKVEKMKALIICHSYHHNNTQKVAEAMAKVLSAEIKTPQQTSPKELQNYDLVGFGSGIYAYQHHTSLLDLADKLMQVSNKKAFVFSTTGAPVVFGESALAKAIEQHKPLREKLQSKGYIIVMSSSALVITLTSFSSISVESTRAVLVCRRVLSFSCDFKKRGFGCGR